MFQVGDRVRVVTDYYGITVKGSYGFVNGPVPNKSTDDVLVDFIYIPTGEYYETNIYPIDIDNLELFPLTKLEKALK